MSRHRAVVTFLRMQWQMRKTMTFSSTGQQTQVCVQCPTVQQEVAGQAKVPVRVATANQKMKMLGAIEQLYKACTDRTTKRPGWSKVQEAAACGSVDTALQALWPQVAGVRHPSEGWLRWDKTDPTAPEPHVIVEGTVGSAVPGKQWNEPCVEWTAEDGTQQQHITLMRAWE